MLGDYFEFARSGQKGSVAVRKTPLWLAALALATSTAYAGHPMLSEDTGTQGRGNAELELGYAWTRVDALSSAFLFQPQLSFGTSTTFDMIVQPSWTSVASKGVPQQRGVGDTNFDFKWRFYGSAPWSVGTRSGLQVPTAQKNLGLPHRKVSPHTLLVVTGDYTPLTVDFNLGYTRVPPDFGVRADLLHFSAAASYELQQRLFFIFDSAVDSNPDSGSRTPPIVALIGLIYTVRPGFDLDIGYRGALNSAAPDRQWLLGITVRGAP
jgi:hypothetical protein